MSDQPPGGPEFRPRPPRRIGAASPGGADRSTPFEPAAARAPAPPPEQPRPARGGRNLLLWAASALVFAGLTAGLLVVLLIEPGLLERERDPAAGLPASFEAALRGALPELPEQLIPLSPIFDVTPPADHEGPVALTISLTAQTRDGRNLGAFTWDGGEWLRLGGAELAHDGSAARVVLPQPPANVAILRRSRFSSIVAGRLPNGAEPDGEVVASLTIVHPDGWRPGDDGSLIGGIDLAAAAVSQSVWPVLRAGPAETGIVNDILASDQLRRRHISAIQFAVQSGRYEGIDIDYPRVSPALRGQFSAFITELAEALHRDDRGLGVHLPLTAGGGFGEGAYDLAILGAAADFVVAEPPLDPAQFEEAVAASFPALLERVDRGRVLLALHPDAIVRSSEGYARISRREALGVAALLSVRDAPPHAPGSSVTLQADSLLLENSSSGLHWDDEADSVAFSYPDAEGNLVTIWIANRFSAAFKLRAVQLHDLGGVYLGDISTDPASASLWQPVAAFFEQGRPDLRLPNPLLYEPVFSVESGELTGAGGTGVQIWRLPRRSGSYEARVIVSDGDARVGRVITVAVAN